jgi:hypothetical protein
VASLILDSGALIAIDRGDRRIGAVLLEAGRAGIDAFTSSTCVAEVWRNPARQARLTRALTGTIEVPLDSQAARRCGELLAIAKTSDIADAAVALLAKAGDVILTSDAGDIEHLVRARGIYARVQHI